MSCFRSSRLRALLLGVCVLLAVVPGWPVAAQSSDDPYGCDNIDTYITEVYWGSIESEADYEAIQAVLETDDIFTLRRTQQRQGAEAFERWAEALDNVPEREIPVAVRDWHEATVDRLSIMSNLLYLLSEGAGAFDVAMYMDSLDEVNTAIDAGWDAAARICGEAWTSHFDRPVATPPAATPVAGGNEFASMMSALREAGLEAEPLRFTVTANQLEPPGHVIEVEGQYLIVFVYPGGGEGVASREVDAADLNLATLELGTRSGNVPWDAADDFHIVEHSNIVAVLVGGDDALVQEVEDALSTMP